MTTHTAHEPVQTHGLVDDCPRCIEHTRRPWNTLDPDTLARIELNPITALDLKARNRLRAWKSQYTGERICIACGELVATDDPYVLAPDGWYHADHYVDAVPR
jgi:hypothetical protein